MEAITDLYGEEVLPGDIIIHNLTYRGFAAGMYLNKTKQKINVLGPGWTITSRWWNFIKAPEHIKLKVLKDWNSSTVESDYYYNIRDKAIKIIGLNRWLEIMEQLYDD